MKKLLQKLKSRVIQKVFSRYYGHFIYPFINADLERSKMPDYAQAKYLETISNWVRSDAFKIEHQAMVAKFITESATESRDEIDLAANRLALIWLRNYEDRLALLAKEFTMSRDLFKKFNNM